MIGVCIKYFHENYGGMLQAFATVKMLESRGIDYELIRYKKKLTIAEKVRSIPRLLNGILLNDKYEAFLKSQGMKKHPEFANNDAVRMKAFEQFKFMIFNRYANASATSKNSRIDSLCQNLGVSERRFSGDILEIQKDINYAEVKNNLNNLQQKTIEYLDAALSQ